MGTLLIGVINCGLVLLLRKPGGRYVGGKFWGFLIDVVITFYLKALEKVALYSMHIRI